MAISFNYDDLPLPTIVLNTIMLLGKDANTKKGKSIIYQNCIDELKYTLVFPEQLTYLSFNLKFDKFGDYVIIKPHNIISALWFCGYYPLDANYVMQENKFFLGDEYFTFNKKTHKLKKNE